MIRYESYLDNVHHRRVGVGPVGAGLVQDGDVGGGQLPAKMEPGIRDRGEKILAWDVWDTLSINGMAVLDK